LGLPIPEIFLFFSAIVDEYFLHIICKFMDNYVSLPYTNIKYNRIMEKIKIFTDEQSAQKQKRNTLAMVDAINDAISELSQLGVKPSDDELSQFLNVPETLITSAIESAQAKHDAFYENYPESDRPQYNCEVLRARIVNIHRRLSHKIPFGYDRNNVLYHVTDGVCALNDNADETLNERYSVYAEIESQMEIWNLANEVCEKLNKLNNLLDAHAVNALQVVGTQFNGVIIQNVGFNADGKRNKMSVNPNVMHSVNH
jgi:hypothetical protein